MSTFDGNAYRKKVLTRLTTDFQIADPVTGDPFFVFDLDPRTDLATIRRRIVDVVSCWQKERNSVKFKSLAADLVARKSQFEEVLLDEKQRKRAARRVLKERAAADVKRFASLDDLASKLTDKFGGIPQHKVAQLQMVARRNDTSDEAFADWLGRHKILPPSVDVAAAWGPSIRQQIRESLEMLARHTNDEGGHVTLWRFLDLPTECSDSELAERHDEMRRANQGLANTSAKTQEGELLAHVKTRLMVDGGREAYAASLLAEATDVVLPDVAEKMLVHDEVSASDYETLVLKVVALDWGLSPTQARQAVRSAATLLGASLAVAPAVDYMLCGHCRSPQIEPTDRRGARCQMCGEALYLACPQCSALVGAAAVTCPECGTSFRAQRETVELIAKCRGLLQSGRPHAAADALRQARARIAEQPEPTRSSLSDYGIRELTTQVGAAIHAAEAEWRSLSDDIEARRVWAAFDRATRMERVASDVRSPAGIDIDTQRLRLGEEKSEIQRTARQAVGLPLEAAETLLSGLLAKAVDCPEAAAALAALPVAAPTHLTTHETTRAAVVTWRRSQASGAVSYRVVRIVGEPQQPIGRSTIGTTSATSLEDAGVPSGVSVRYEVTARLGQRSSESALSDAFLIARDVEALELEVSDDSVEVRWTAPSGEGVAMVERRTLSPGHERSPMRRIRPTTHGRYRDTDATAGLEYGYRVFMEYRLPDKPPIRTAGQTMSAALRPRPMPVTDLAVTTDQTGTKLRFTPPPLGEVQIYATSGPNAAAVAEARWSGSTSALADLIREARLVGSGRSEASDPVAIGHIIYTPITVLDDKAVAGRSLVHVAVQPVADLKANDEGEQVRLTFTLPRGITEAMVRWRFDKAPIGEDSVERSAKVTNTKLEIDGGYSFQAPADGRSLYVSVAPVVRQGAERIVASQLTTLQVRQALPMEIRYRLTRPGMLRRSMRLEVDATPHPVPRLVLVYQAGSQLPASAASGEIVASIDRSVYPTVSVDIDPSTLPADGNYCLRLFVDENLYRPVNVIDPEPDELRTGR